MKRLIITLIPLLLVYCASAQTYNGGTWYSLYDTQTHTMNTQGDYETGGIFAPTAGKLNVHWTYEWIDWVGFARKIDTNVLESADDGESTRQVGSFAENTNKNSSTTETFNVSTNINWIKFERSGLPTHKVNVDHIDIPLAQHILLAKDVYGTNEITYDFNELDALETSEPYKVQLRSFLSVADITISSSDPEIFHVGSADSFEPLVYAVGANACASANGKADAVAEGVLANIANYAFDVYFTPQSGKQYVGCITVSDGKSTARVFVNGKGRKLDQTISWTPESPILSNAQIQPAEASSGLDIDYSFSPEGIVTYEQGSFVILGDGKVSVTASQAGNDIYNAAEPVTRELTIFPAETNYVYEQAICQGDVYSDEHFDGLEEGGLYYDTIPNVYGGDSVICLSLTVNPTYFYEDDTRTMYAGVHDTWQGIDLATLPVGDTLLVAKYTTLTGCDSVYTLAVTVNPMPVTYGNDTVWLCAGETAEYEGKTYKRPAKDSVLVSEPNQFGGDSIVEFVVYVFPLMKMQATNTITEGDEQEWQHIDLSQLPVGDTTLVATYTSVNGCDSVYILKLTVTEKLPMGYENMHMVGDRQKVVIDGHLYIRKDDAWFDSQGRKISK